MAAAMSSWEKNLACVLTHVQLPNEAGHVAVLEVKRQ